MAGEINFGLLDSSIPGRVANSFYEGQQRRKQNVLSDLALSQAEQQAADEAAMRDAYKASAGDTNALLGALQQKGLYKQAEAVKQKQLEQEAKRVEMKAKVSDIAHKKLAMYRDALSNVSSPQDAMAWMDAQYSDPDVSAVLSSLGPREKSLASIPQDPMQLEQWKQKAALGMTKFVEMNKPVVSTENLGDRSVVLSRPGLGGAPEVIGTMERGQSPESRASNAVQIRGQNMADARAREMLQQGGRAPAGYRFTADGNMEPIPGGPADAKAQALANNKAAGASDVDVAISTLRDAYDRLESGGGITSTKNSALSNLGASTSSSAMGQAMGRALGTQNQSARNDIAMARPALLAALMKATGMSAKQMDSNAELKLWLSTATDPTLDVESNRRALANIERKYLSVPSKTLDSPTQKTVVKTGSMNGRKVVQYSDGSIDYAD